MSKKISFDNKCVSILLPDNQIITVFLRKMKNIGDLKKI